MKRRRFANPQNSLPIDIIHDEILSKLPVKSLLRFRCVSKLWCSIIDDSSFASTHFNKCQTNQEKTRFLVLEPPDMCDSKQICAIRNCEKFRKMSKVGIEVTWYEEYQAMGYVNGLLCIKRYVKETQISKILLWNPSIRKGIELPFPRFTSNVAEKFDIDCALGYDHVNKDYKVIASVYIGNEHHTPRYVEVFTLSAFSWKSANIGQRPCRWIKDSPKVFLNGVVYWGGINIFKDTPKDRFSHFVSFDAVNDAFKYIDLPDSEQVHMWYERFPIILHQSVGLLEVFKSYSQIWIMEESKNIDDIQSCWKKTFKIDLQLFEKCIYFKMDGELLFAGEKGGIKSYNINNQESKVLAKSYKLSPIFICVYMESLALLHGIPGRPSYSLPPNVTNQSD